MRKIGLALAAVVALAAYSKVLWMRGFDTGADVSLCVVASMQNGGKLDTSSTSCRRAHDREDDPDWMLLRRRGHGE